MQVMKTPEAPPSEKKPLQIPLAPCGFCDYERRRLELRAHIAVAAPSEPSNRTPASPVRSFTFPGLRLWGCHVLVPALRVIGNRDAFPARPRHRAAQTRIGRKCACLKKCFRLRDPSLNAYCGGPGAPINRKCNRLATRGRNSRKKCQVATLQIQ